MRSLKQWMGILVLMTGVAGCAELDQFAKNVQIPLAKTDSGGKIIAGLKEALSIGTGNAVIDVSKAGGYFRNQAIKILLPAEIQKTGQALRKFGFGRVVDDFEHSMNTAAEKAAPQAKAIFLDAITQMTFEDARRILNGPDTAATDYLRAKTSPAIAKLFRPIITDTMNQVGVTRLYKQMVEPLKRLPIDSPVPVDLDGYVTDKALHGLFVMVAEEEKKIRRDPAARVTQLLKDVFGNMRG
ncbi:MAG: DUF4197 family protein [Nitrospinaceae bacterium]|nr:DUF4197 domain-containing protein [Nitrospinaceae bacterium]NIR56495.1 DUF4197 domain-containing protein [Nitrospinaceae bacterium]NIS86953.1 DUF4197 domain-containing protein [Nitrospinaceae bacterium]NIT83797.1 DUF4197 domain-containing protein [Nitrospinaceae bacterium]NIU46003.1 DUF4197 domain-containing protein [Nitrospinaceae bacterium]